MTEKKTSQTPSTRGGRNKGQIKLQQSPTCKLTEELIKEFAEILQLGNFRYTAMQRLGITRHTYSEWISAGRKQIKEFEQGLRPELLAQGKFVLACDEAEGWVHGRMIEDILSSPSIPARQWYLEHRFPKLYNKGATSLDDGTQEETKVDPVALLAEKIAGIGKSD